MAFHGCGVRQEGSCNIWCPKDEGFKVVSYYVDNWLDY